MTIWHRILLLLLAAVAAVGENTGPAVAHPHVWVNVRDVIIFDNGIATGVEHEWTFDEMYTVMAIEGLDTNKDGIFDRAELQPLAQTNIDGLKEFENFTYASQGTKKLAFGAPRDYWLEYNNKILKLHFFLPFAEPLKPPFENVKIAVEDPSYFIAFDFAKDNPVTASAGAPASCKVAFVRDTADSNQSALTQAFGAQLTPLGAGISGVIAVGCAK